MRHLTEYNKHISAFRTLVYQLTNPIYYISLIGRYQKDTHYFYQFSETMFAYMGYVKEYGGNVNYYIRMQDLTIPIEVLNKMIDNKEQLSQYLYSPDVISYPCILTPYEINLFHYFAFKRKFSGESLIVSDTSRIGKVVPTSNDFFISNDLREQHEQKLNEEIDFNFNLGVRSKWMLEMIQADRNGDLEKELACLKKLQKLHDLT